jgi:hypothetical protein
LRSSIHGVHRLSLGALAGELSGDALGCSPKSSGPAGE